MTQQPHSGRLATKEKSAAPIQITAEQLLRESAALQSDEVSSRTPARRLVDEDELNEFRVRKRKQYEDSLRRRRHSIGIWIQYGQWEAEQLDFRRARSVFERALAVESDNVQLWNRYLDMEIRHKHINSARNLFDRVVALLPRLDHFWLRYAAFEETLMNYIGVRNVFERWMKWEPDVRAWMTYVHFEERCNELGRARKILERFLTVHPRVSSFLKFAQFEENHKELLRARGAYETAVQILPKEELTEDFFLKFAHFEERHKELDRARLVYTEGLKLLGDERAEKLSLQFSKFQKRTCAKDELEKHVLHLQKKAYLEQIQKNPYAYDVWFNLLRLEEASGPNDFDDRRGLYEEALKNEPPISSKSAYKRYFYLMLSYAIFEELEANDAEAARKVWIRIGEALRPHSFSFAKYWVMFAQFELRQKDVQAARTVMNQGMEQYPVEKVFRAYCDIELKLGNIDRARWVCAKYIEIQPSDWKSWLMLIDLELLSKEIGRARKLFEYAIELGADQTAANERGGRSGAADVDGKMGTEGRDGTDERNRDGVEAVGVIQNPEPLWKAYIDVEAKLLEFKRCRRLFERLFEKTRHWKVLKAYADFEIETSNNADRARELYQKAIFLCKEQDLDSSRALLLEQWLDLEKSIGDKTWIQKVLKMQPRKIHKRRVVSDPEAGTPAGATGGATGTAEVYETYTAYIFDDDDSTKASALAILEAAKKWKKRRAEVDLT